MANEVTRMGPPVQEFRGELAKMAQEFEKVLPAHITPDKFQRVVVTAVQLDPVLLQADRRSFIASIMKCAQDGLLPDKREAAFVIFSVKDGNNWVKQVQYMPMIYGLFKKMRQSGEIASISCHVVHENDQFHIELGDNEQFHHIPEFKNPGEPIGAYAIAMFKDGTRAREFMPVAEIEKVRAVSKNATGKNAPWSVWWDEMAKKTVVRRMSKRLPMSSDVELILERDNDLYELPDMGAPPTAEQLQSRPTAAQISGPEDTVPAEDEPEKPDPEKRAEENTQAEPESDHGNNEGEKADGGADEATYPYLSPDGEVIEFADPAYFVQAFKEDCASGDDRQREGLRESNETTLETLPAELREECLEAAGDLSSPTPAEETAPADDSPPSSPQSAPSPGLSENSVNLICNALRNSTNEGELQRRVSINKGSYDEMSQAQKKKIDAVVAEMRAKLHGGRR